MLNIFVCNALTQYTVIKPIHFGSLGLNSAKHRNGVGKTGSSPGQFLSDISPARLWLVRSGVGRVRVWSVGLGLVGLVLGLGLESGLGLWFGLGEYVREGKCPGGNVLHSG